MDHSQWKIRSEQLSLKGLKGRRGKGGGNKLTTKIYTTKIALKRVITRSDGTFEYGFKSKPGNSV